MALVRPATICCNKYALICVCIWSFLLLIFYVTNDYKSPTFPHGLASFLGDRLYRNLTLLSKHDVNADDDTLTSRSRQECIHPHLKVDDPIMTKFFRRLEPVQCQEEPDWVYVTNGTVRYTPSALDKYKPVKCDYFPLLRDGDYKVKWGQPTRAIHDGFLVSSDYCRIACSGKNGRTYDGIHLSVAYTKERAERKEVPLPTSMDALSIAVLGFDSMSRMSWLRRLTKTREYVHGRLGAIELEAHNIVGDGTTAVMFPMLTGKFEWELPECRRGFKGATTMDSFPFLWHEMKKLGYLTSWCNAAPATAPFNYRMLGFTDQPTDFYTRPFYIAATPLMANYSRFCIGSRPQSQVWLNYFRDIFTVYKNKRKFLFHFITEFSHDDNNRITMMDDDIKNTIQFLHEGGYLNKTLLILMGDHGARYNYVRSTWAGKLEERLPYFSFLFPDWFLKKYPEAIRNLRTNTKRLTTPFDMYETFRDILNFTSEDIRNVSQRGISLFKEIPPERSCEHAGIAPHWCACLAWQNVSVNDPEVQQALQISLNTINNYTAPFRDDCALLIIANISMVTKLETRSEVLKFKKTDSNGGIYKIDLSAKNTNEIVLYQLTFFTTPGGGHFEVTVTHDLVKKKFMVSDKEISRINKYGNDPACILDKSKQIRQYCYCKSNIKS